MNDQGNNERVHESRLPLFPHGAKKGPFIADQGLRWLQTVDGVQPIECLDPARFREARRALEDRSESLAVGLPAGCCWKEISTAQERADFLANVGAYNRNEFHRIILMIEAGMGKTTTVQQVMYLRNCGLPGHLAMGFNFARLPQNVADYLDNDQCWLCEQFKNLESLTNANVRDIRQLILRRIQKEQFTLVVDSFDQVARLQESEIRDKTHALKEFLNRYPRVRVVCAGRPNSIIELSPEFVDMGQWTFAQIDEFTKDQQIKYLGQERSDSLKTLEMELLSQPRMLEAIRRLEPEQLSRLRTASALHWQALDHVVTEAYKLRQSSLRVSKMRRLVAAIAFQMIEEQNFDGVYEDDFDDFVLRLIGDRGKPFARVFGHVDAVERGIDELGKLNELLDFAVLEDGKHGQIVFRNRTLQAFFAALWCTKYDSRDAQIDFLQQHLYIRGRKGEHYRNGDYYEFWKFATEMPSNVREDMHYVRSMSALFLPQKPCDPIRLIGSQLLRSTEMIYRSLWELLEIADHLRAPRRGAVYETEIMEAVRKCQADIRRSYESGDFNYDSGQPVPTDAKAGAQFLIKQFLSEFLALKQGKIGEADQTKLAIEFDRIIKPNDPKDPKHQWHGFLKIPSGKFWFGENPSHQEHMIEPFWLSRFPTTNEILRLFDPTHGLDKSRFAADYNMAYAQVSPHPRCPAIYVDWYTAFCASLWFGGELPDEYQWERACRGLQNVPTDPATKFYSGNELNDLWQVAFYQISPTGGGTRQVGLGTKLPNNLGLKHMHGNVREWTMSWYSHKPGMEIQRNSSELKGSIAAAVIRFCGVILIIVLQPTE